MVYGKVNRRCSWRRIGTSGRALREYAEVFAKGEFVIEKIVEVIFAAELCRLDQGGVRGIKESEGTIAVRAAMMGASRWTLPVPPEQAGSGRKYNTSAW